MRFFVFGAMLLVGLLFGAVAEAGAIPSLIKNGGETKFEDEDFEVLLRRDLSGDLGLATTIEENDYLVGAYRLEGIAYPGSLDPSVSLPTGSGFEVTGIFATKILSKSGNAIDGFTYTLGAADDDLWSDLGITRTNSGTILTMYNNVSPITNVAADGTLGPVQSVLSQAEFGLASFEFGFTGVDGTAAGKEFLDGESESDDTLTAGGAQNDVSYSAGLTLLVDNEPTVVINPADLQGLGFPVDMYLTGSVDEITNPLFAMPVFTDTDLFVSATIVPEPGSIAIWGCVALVGVVGYRRRKISKI